MGRTVLLGSGSLIALLLGAASPAVAQPIPPGVAIDATDNDVSPSPASTPTWTLGPLDLIVGQNRRGALTIGAGGAVTNVGGTIGWINGSVGTVTVTGAGARWDNTDYLTVGESGNGTLSIGAGGTVTSRYGYIGFINRSVGTVTVTGAGATWANSGDLTVGYSGQGSLTIGEGGTVTNVDGTIGMNSGSSAVGTVSVAGTGARWDNYGNLSIGNNGQGTLSIGAGGAVTNGVGYIGRSTTSVGTVTVAGAGARWENSNNLHVGYNGQGRLTIADGGTVSSAGGSGLVHLGYSSASAGTLNIGAATGRAGTLEAAEIRFGDGTGKLVFNHTDSNYRFAPRLVSSGTGAHTVAHLAGTTLLTGDSSSFTGTTTVSGGTLLVGDATGGKLGGIVNVASGGTLGGSGTLTGNVMVDGTLSAGSSPGTLTFTSSSSLTLNSGSRTVFELNTPGIVGGTGLTTGNDLVKVDGVLILGGTLEAHVASAGYYRLFEYSVRAPSSFDTERVTSSRAGFTVASHQVQYGIPHQVNLSVLGTGQTMQFWDGADIVGNGAVDGGSGTWGSASNWTGQPGQANINGTWGGSVGVFMGAAGTVTVSGTQNVDTLQFSTDGYRLSGGTLAFNPASGPTATIRVDNGVGVTIGSVLTDGTGNSLAKTGAGTLTLTGANSYSGVTTVSAGVLNIQNAGALGTTAGGTVVASGAALELLAPSDTLGMLTIAGEALSLAGSGINNGGALRNVEGYNSYAGAITLTAATRINSDTGTLLLRGGISGAHDLTLGGASAGLVTGVTNVTALTKDGNGYWALYGANSYSGVTTIRAGALIGYDPNAFSAASAHIVAAGAKLDLRGYDQEIGSLTGDAGAMVANGSSSAVTLTIGRDNSSTVYAGTIQGNGGPFPPGPFPSGGSLSLIKTGTGRLTLTDANSYSGVTTVNAGVLNIQNSAALGSIAGGTVVASGAALELENTTFMAIAGEALSLAGSGINNGGALRNVAGHNTYGGAITLTAATRINSDSDTLRLTGGISGAHELTLGGDGLGYVGGVNGAVSLTKDGTGDWVLTGANSYTGATMVNAGTLIGGNVNALSAASALVLAAGTRLSLGGTDQEIGSLAGAAGAVVRTYATPSPTLTTGGDNRSTDYAGAIQDGGGPFGGQLALTKTGTGVMTLSGASTYTGNTRVNGGELRVNGSLGNTAVVVNAGATLSGTGTIGGTVTVNNGGTLSAGNSPGTLTFTSNLALAGGSRSVFELNTPGIVGGAGLTTGNDLVKVGGTLALGGTLEAHVASAGYYRLFTYGTLAAGSSFGAETVTSSQAGFTVAGHQVQYGIAGQVNLWVLGAGQIMQFWDGMDTVGNGAVDGGSGIWGPATNWTGQPGQAGINGSWSGSTGVFGGAAGTVTVSGTQGFDTLQFSTDGYRLSGGTLVFNPASGLTTTILVDSGVGVTIGSVLADGTGNSLTKTGAGTLTLTGANTYTGGTTINAGVLSVAADANLGAASGGLAVNGGTLATTASFDTARAVALGAGGGGFDIGTATTLGLTGTVSGPGDLIKRGAGTLVLSGANGYGNTQVQAGTLVGNAAAISGDVGTAGTVVFDQATHAGFAGDIAGLSGHAGAMIKRGAGTLTLTGRSALDWSVEAGGLVSGTGRFRGNVAIAAPGSFSFDQASDGSYAGIVSGSGRFAKTGSGHVLLTGNSSGFTGLTTIGGGTLSVGDASGGSLGGSLLVASGGLLGGTGTVGSAGATITIAAGGVHAPGNSIGTQTIAGNYANHGTLRIEGTPARTDKIVVAGTADITGATLDLVLSPMTATTWSAINGPFTIIDKQSAGAVTGTFATVTNTLIFLDPSLSYAGGDGNDVTLQLTRNDLTFAGVGITRNQMAAGGAVDTLPNTSSVWRAIALSTHQDSVRRSFDALSGEVHASARSALIEDSRFVRAAAIDRLRAAFGDVGASPAPVMAYAAGGPQFADATTDRFAAWGIAFGTWGRFNSDGNAARLTRSTGGFLIGADGLVADDWRLGLMAGYSRSSFTTRDRAAAGASDNYHLGLYAGTQWGNLAFRSGLAYTWHDVTTGRSVALPGFADSLKSHRDAGTVQAFGELGYRISAGPVRFEPFANLAYVGLRADGFSERGGAAALSIQAGATGVTFTTLGLRTEAGFTLGAMEATARAALGWRHAFGDRIPLSTQAFAGSGAFTVAGVPIAGDSAVVEAALDLKFTAAATVGLSYIGQIARDAQDHGVKANLAVRF